MTTLSHGSVVVDEAPQSGLTLAKWCPATDFFVVRDGKARCRYTTRIHHPEDRPGCARVDHVYHAGENVAACLGGITPSSMVFGGIGRDQAAIHDWR